LRALWPEPNIDRRGRLLGNVQGLFSLIDPRRPSFSPDDLSVAPHPGQRNPDRRKAGAGLDRDRLAKVPLDGQAVGASSLRKA
jgi:hypothetical protein